MTRPQAVDEGYERPLLALISRNVELLKTAQGESQSVLAAVLGVSQGQVSDRLHGKVDWSFRDVALLAAHWNLTPFDLMGPTEHLPWDRLDPTERFGRSVTRQRVRTPGFCRDTATAA